MGGGQNYDGYLRKAIANKMAVENMVTFSKIRHVITVGDRIIFS